MTKRVVVWLHIDVFCFVSENWALFLRNLLSEKSMILIMRTLLLIVHKLFLKERNQGTQLQWKRPGMRFCQFFVGSFVLFLVLHFCFYFSSIITFHLIKRMFSMSIPKNICQMLMEIVMKTVFGLMLVVNKVNVVTFYVYHFSI